MLDRRKIELIKILMHDNSFHSVASLSRNLACSQRTIRNDLPIIDAWLGEKGLPTLDRSNAAVGMHPQLDKVRLVGELKRENQKTMDEFPDARTDAMMRLILKKGRISLHTLAKTLNVSFSTVIANIKPMSKRLEKYGLKLERNQSFLSVLGDENFKRRAYLDCIRQSSKKQALTHFDDLDERIESLKSMMDAEMVDEARRQIDHLQETQHFEFSVESYINILIHIVLAIQRIREDKVIEINETELYRIKGKGEYQDAVELARLLSKKFNVTFTESETAYLTYHLLGASVAYREKDELTQNHPELDEELERLIGRVEKHLNLDFQDHLKIKKGLILHIIPAIERIRVDRPVENPLLTKFQLSHGPVFEAVRIAISEIEANHGLTFNDDELCYIAMHFAANLASESSSTHGNVRILLVCSSGVGTSQLLASRLSYFFEGYEIVDIVSKSRVNECLQKLEFDHIVTTVPLKSVGMRMSEVTPLLSDVDIKKLSEVLPRRKTDEFDENNGILEEFAAIVNQVTDQETAARIMNEVSVRFSKQTNKHKAGNVRGSNPSILFPQGIVKIQRSMNLEGLIDECAQPLLASDRIRPEYIRQLKAHYDEHPGWIMIAPGIAMPHAYNDGNVLQASIVVALLEQRFEIDHRFGPIDTVVMLAPYDKTSHVNTLTHLIELLSVEKTRDRLRKLTTSEVYDVIMKEGWL